jgi:hypothetical protein
MSSGALGSVDHPARWNLWRAVFRRCHQNGFTIAKQLSMFRFYAAQILLSRWVRIIRNNISLAPSAHCRNGLLDYNKIT